MILPAGPALACLLAQLPAQLPSLHRSERAVVVSVGLVRGVVRHVLTRPPALIPHSLPKGPGSCDLSGPTKMTESTLNAEHRRALATLATAGLDGATQSLLSAHGFGASLVVGLVDRGLVTIMYDRVRTGGASLARR